ncbi:MAG: hypothetical protein C4557_12755 [Anaerolineaceae bacterium]|jgi:hypothetical protein|nr:MAG: hypothetical protein C4557_12755 [Anaerolineaceae bacterium]
MKKTILIVALVAAALVIAGVGVVYAQDGTPPFGGRGMRDGQGPMHTFMVTEFAKKLNLNVNDINTRLAAGETMYDIALSAGVTAEEFPAIMQEVRANALDAAVKANVITQEQADWMKSRGFGRGGMGYGAGDCTGLGYGQNGSWGGHGPGMMGRGWQNQPATP